MHWPVERIITVIIIYLDTEIPGKLGQARSNILHLTIIKLLQTNNLKV